MGGKRPDQYNIEPSEAGATDMKNLPQTGRGQSSQTDDRVADKQRLAELPEEGNPFPPDVPAPSAHTKHGRPQQEHDEESIDRAGRPDGAAQADVDRENPLA